MPIQGGIESIDDDAMDVLFGAKTPGADAFAGPQRGEPDNINPEDPDADSEGTPAPKKRVVLEQTPAQKAASKSADEVADELFGTEGDADPHADPDAPKPEPKKVAAKPAAKAPKAEDNLEVDLKAYYDMMVEAKVWGEVEVPDDAKWDLELIKEIQALQVSHQYQDLLDRKGPYGKAIVEYEDNGGNPSDLIDLFREQRTVRQFDVSTPEGQEEFLTSYFEAQNYSTKSTDRLIKSLIDQGGDALKEEAEEKKALWDKDYEAEIEATKQQQALAAKQMEEHARNFNKVMSEAITSDPDLTPKERRELATYILDYSHKYGSQRVNQFYVDAAEIQKDPAAYIELAKFMKGLKDGTYKKKIADTSKKEANAKTFMKVKNGSALARRDGGQPELQTADNESSFLTYLSGKK
jgi:hypothetical protein